MVRDEDGVVMPFLICATGDCAVDVGRKTMGSG